MKSAIPAIIYDQITQTNSSPETIAALLNEAENTYSKEPLHWNTKRRYPFWKVCKRCHAVFPCKTKAQVKNQFCGQDCVNAHRSKSKRGRPLKAPVILTCQQCGKKYPRKNSTDTKFCNRKCYGKWRSTDPEIVAQLQKIASRGRAGWTDESRVSYNKKMSGANNPAWKGGVTYFRKKGNYGIFRIKYVRCPQDFLPMARKDGYIMEHRLLVAQAMGRLLKRSEVVHHKDHNPENNDLSNLALFASNSQHKKHEATGQPAPLWQL